MSYVVLRHIYQKLCKFPSSRFEYTEFVAKVPQVIEWIQGISACALLKSVQELKPNCSLGRIYVYGDEMKDKAP